MASTFDQLLMHRLAKLRSNTEGQRTQCVRGTSAGASRRTKFAKLQRLPSAEERPVAVAERKSKVFVKPLEARYVGASTNPTPRTGMSLLERRYMTRRSRQAAPTEFRPTLKQFRTGHSVWGLKRGAPPVPPQPRAASHPTRHHVIRKSSGR